MDPGEATSKAISVAIADDEPHVVTYLETVLGAEGFDVAGSASDAHGAVELVSRVHPDVVLLDLHMPGGGQGAARQIGALSPETHILVFSADANDAALVPLLRTGIDGFVVKGCAPDRLVEAVLSVVSGGKYLTPEVNRIAIEQLTSRLHAEERLEVQRVHLRRRVARMMAKADYSVVFQPIVDLGSGAVRGVESLTRFRGTPPRPPLEWFADADAVGMRPHLELATASAALRQLDDLRPELFVAVNISPATVLSGRLAEVLEARPLDRVVVELTEHAPVVDYGPLEEALQPWRRDGLRLAVDDAGGGYASFAHILNLVPDFIKLDTSLTRELQFDEPRRALARAIVGFAVEMGVSVVAEGIESQLQLDTLRALGTPLGQGYHLGRPAPLDQLPDLLARSSTTRRSSRAAPQRR